MPRPGPRARATALLTIALGTAALVGCADSRSPQIATFAGQPGVGDSALLESRLALEGSCVVVQTADGGHVVPLFPEGTRWDAEAGAVALGGELLAVGREVQLGGSGAVSPEASTLPQACRGHDSYRSVSAT